MPLRLEVKKKLSARSERVKSVDVHPTEPWVLSALFSGAVIIWDYESGTSVKSFELGNLPVRCAKFITRRQWFVAGSDDMHMRVYNYNTMEKVKDWEAHVDYIRYIEVHPSRPYILSCADDMTIKLWDWEKDFECAQVFEGHAHYVMMVKVNPRDSNTFASASLDRTIKVWGLTGALPHFSLEGHEKGVNCVDYYPGGDKPYLLSGADDRTVKIWDYQTKACLQTLDGHTHNVTAVCFHPRLPLIVSSSEDGTVRIWHSTTYRPETTLNYGMERAWCLAPTKGANKLAIGYDEGTIVLKLGHEMPIASLDTHTAKLVWAQGFDIQTMSVRGLSAEETVDGERLALSPRDMGACEVYPQSLSHNRNGQFIVVCGDGEYIIYTSQALRNKAFGSALEFVWSSLGTGDYAIRESISRVKSFKNFKEHKQIRLPMSTAEGLVGGVCLGVIGPDCIAFFDWDEGEFIRKIDVAPRTVFWSDSGEFVVLACTDSYFVLRFHRDVVANALASPGGSSSEDGIEGAFELLSEINDRVRTAQWVGDCFLYTNYSNRLQYYVGGEVMTLCHLDRIMYLLGYVPREERVFLIDRAYNVVSYKVLQSVLTYQTAVVRQDFETANTIISQIPPSEYPAIARFLESQGFKEEALAVTTDPDHKFDLAMDLKKIDVAHSLLLEIPEDEKETTDTQTKWRRLGDIALAKGDLQLAKQCAINSGDLSGLLLLYSSSCDKEGMKDLAIRARHAGRTNVAFVASFVTGQVEDCIDILIETSRFSEAAFMARTYMPSLISDVLKLWKEQLETVNERAAAALADPNEYPNLFPDLEWAYRVEELFKERRNIPVPANQYPVAKQELDMNLIELLKAQGPLPPRQPTAAKPMVTSPPTSPTRASQSPTPAPNTPSPVAAPAISPTNSFSPKAGQNGSLASPVATTAASRSPVNHRPPSPIVADSDDLALEDELKEDLKEEDHEDLDKLEAEADDLLTEEDDNW